MSAIANARTHRCERRARVGVVVLGVKSCQAVPVNREARRLAKGLLPPGHPLGQFPEVVRFRLAA